MLCDGQQGRPLIYRWEKNDKGNWHETTNPLYIEQFTYDQIRQFVISEIKGNGDGYIGIDGEEGSGKSIFASQLGALITWIASNYLRKKRPFDHKNFTWRVNAFIRANYDLPHWSVVVLDESRSAAGRSRTTSKDNVRLTNFISESRDDCHKFCLIVLPKIHDLDSYLSEHRIKMLFSFYKKETLNKLGMRLTAGNYRFFGHAKMKEIASRLRKGDKQYYPRTRYANLRTVKYPAVNWGKVKERKSEVVGKTYLDSAQIKTPKEIREEARAEIALHAAEQRESHDLTIKDLLDVLGMTNYEYYKYVSGED